jgi:hypothetical protein
VYTIYIILVVLPLLATTIIAKIVDIYKKLPRFCYVVLFCILAAISFATFRSHEKRFMLSFTPDAFEINSISYSKEESWGFGPGGNEAGIRVYPLSAEIAKQISEHGINFLNNMPPNRNQRHRRWRGNYSNWSETPMRPDRRWQPNKKTKNFDIYDYICAYSIRIDIEPKVVAEANAIVNGPGSYYAYGRIGLIVVCPGKKIVLYMYNG